MIILEWVCLYLFITCSFIVSIKNLTNNPVIILTSQLKFYCFARTIIKSINFRHQEVNN